MEPNLSIRQRMIFPVGKVERGREQNVVKVAGRAHTERPAEKERSQADHRLASSGQGERGVPLRGMVVSPLRPTLA